MVFRQLAVHGLSDSTKALMDIDRKRSQNHLVCDHCGIVVAQGRIYSEFVNPKSLPVFSHIISLVGLLTWGLKPAEFVRMVAALLIYVSTVITGARPVGLHSNTACTPFW